MIPPVQLPDAAKKVQGATEHFFRKIKKQKPKDLDVQMQQLHEDVFENIDCLTCANCCKTTSPIFYQKDIERASKKLRLSPQQFIEKYLHVDADKDYVLNSAPCPFLDGDNYCQIYADRPNACREYPHTDRKRFFQITDLTLKNTFICPAAFEIVERLKKVYTKI